MDASSSSNIASSSSTSLLSASMDQHAELLMQKLEEVKEVRQNTLELEEVQVEIEEEITVRDREETALADYRRELELLHQEKMAHVEELRLIHKDMAVMEATVKACETELHRAKERASTLYQGRYQPLREDVERKRAALGLTRLPETNLTVNKANLISSTDNSTDKNKRQKISWSVGGEGQPTAFRQPLVPATAPAISMGYGGSSNQKGETRAKAAAAAAAAAVVASGGSASGLGFGGFRQQPPPMKSCLSCHQQIHRNAPICPLCKAKSRSRHPKKPKHGKSK